ncbi:4-(cytidine 5'-diphospho)-2-C-methyl-D-erythritol kinase [Corynebacterium liangguodongii]|uniref:4-diphosphocytidyl-2-C-methyl-D-erythritol kinase n=1 Tax=Corynebacterium liangguodongii TaxID=2079535 RepID=A0A2S0WD43_9CORY|nr:4-(cytidine 5'-diphospho)-2-C-methyl-D-erythritol kinase [Corynebacterium liangguodongii]AWB83689.1 4-(cytidine 5'-diphospho)-2-C-methyl-D-erythritol kinase [Corynebacterium liangguodongii]PWB99501.1 4-(cytidine 5'-diphospho)-2-C-methyl-D-erythritol kinase [Corynebacterium liangguodongii]
MTVDYTASAPGKVNLHLGVGEARPDGYHELSTVFQAVDRREVVVLAAHPERPAVASGSVVARLETTFRVTRPTEDIDTPRNLAWRAVDAAVEAYRRLAPAPAPLPPVDLAVDKSVFVAGGMAGGSADAAAALVAAAAYVEDFTGFRLDDTALLREAAALGADVPFCLQGGTALGSGRGDELCEMMSRGEYWWVFINPMVALPTGETFACLDDMRHGDASLVPHMGTTRLAQALVTGDPRRVAAALHNDLEPAAVALRPQLRRLLDVAGSRGLKAIVSGSGPTVALLCEDALSAINTRDEIYDQYDEFEAVFAKGPVEGAVVQ